MDVHSGAERAQWQKHMIQVLKTENPEINTLLLELANQSADPKGVVAAGLAVYKALDLSMEAQEELLTSLGV